MAGTTRLRVRLPPLHASQQEIFSDPARFKVIVCGRRWGKTVLGVVACLAVALAGGRAWWVAPTYAIGGLGWDLLRPLLRMIPGVDVNKAERLAVFPGGGSIQVKSADRPDSLRGPGLDLVVLDEAALIKEETWTEVLRPTLSDRKGKAIFISTPKGRANWFHGLYEKATADGKVWKAWQKPTRDNPHIDPAEIEDARGDMSALMFAQEYLAQFVVAAGNLIKRETFRYYDEDDQIYLVQREGAPARRYAYEDLRRFATVDLALSEKTAADYTAIGVWGRTPENDLLLLDMIRGKWEAPEILPMLRFAFQRWQIAYAGIERVAYQQAMIQFARREGLPIRELRPDKDKISRAMALIARLEGQNVWFPRHASWLAALEGELLEFPEGTNDDQVDVCSYAVLEVWTGAAQRLITW